MKISINQPYGYTQIGQRKGQQDSIAPQAADTATRCFVVCDGVGGLERGEVASALVAETVERMVEETLADGGTFGVAELQRVLCRAYDCLYDNRSVSHRMATTLAMMVMTGRGVLVAHIGDSPILQLRPHEGTIFRTFDHSLVAEMVARGDISAEEALQHPQRNIITRCMFVPDRQRRISQATVDMIADVRPGDVFLLCSDGVNGAVSEEYIARLLTADDLTLQQKGELLQQQTADSHDNNTAWIVEVADVEHEEGDPMVNSTCETAIESVFDDNDSIADRLRRWWKDVTSKW